MPRKQVRRDIFPLEAHLTSNSFFDSPMFSDVVVYFGKESLRAHRVKLAEASRYFKDILTRATEKARTTDSDDPRERWLTSAQDGHPDQIHLKGDEPTAVRGLIAWIYDVQYDGKDYFAGSGCSLLSIEIPGDAAEYAVYLVGLYAAAHKYGMEQITSVVQKVLPTVLQTVKTDQSLNPKLCNIARHIFCRHKAEAVELRPGMISVFGSGITRFSGTEEFDTLLRQVPDVAAELVEGLALVARLQAEEARQMSDILSGIKRAAEAQGGRPLEPPATRPSTAPANTPDPCNASNSPQQAITPSAFPAPPPPKWERTQEVLSGSPGNGAPPFSTLR